MGKNRRTHAQRKIAAKWTGIGQGLLITAVVSFLFYRSAFGMAAGILIVPFWNRLYKDSEGQKLQAKKTAEFKEFVLLLDASLQAGYSMEKALKNAESEMKQLMGKQCHLLRFIHEMNQKIAMNTPMEQAFAQFARQIEMEDAQNLSEILSFAKRSGGDYAKHVRNTAGKIDDKLMVQQEIDTLTSEKQLELKIMSAMPLMILAYVSLTSYSFVAPLYHNALGVIIMSVCLVIYGAMILLARRLTWIQV